MSSPGSLFFIVFIRATPPYPLPPCSWGSRRWSIKFPATSNWVEQQIEFMLTFMNHKHYKTCRHLHTNTRPTHSLTSQCLAAWSGNKLELYLECVRFVDVAAACLSFPFQLCGGWSTTFPFCHLTATSSNRMSNSWHKFSSGRCDTGWTLKNDLKVGRIFDLQGHELHHFYKGFIW